MTRPHDLDGLPEVSGTDGAGGKAHGGTLGPAPSVEGYEVGAALGAGGTGTVWRAVQLGTRREVALKLLAPGAFGSEKARARFEREVELASRLEHPHIARVYDSGLHHGVYCYAMELVEGRSLDRYVRELHLSSRAILELMVQVCRAVQHAHQRGVIHRDLKPSNILVTEAREPRVLDFGLAKALVSEETDLRVSMEGEIAGTPAYMSPEQALGHVDELDTRTDVYALGVMLYELLCGKLPHELTGGRYEVLRRIAEEEVRRPREANPKLDHEMEAVLLKALAQKPDERYATAGELADDLDNYLRGEPLSARRLTTAYFLRKKAWKHRTMAVFCILLLLLCAGSVALIHQQSRIRRAVIQQDEAKDLIEQIEQTLDDLELGLPADAEARPKVQELRNRVKELDSASEFFPGVRSISSKELQRTIERYRELRERQKREEAITGSRDATSRQEPGKGRP